MFLQMMQLIALLPGHEDHRPARSGMLPALTTGGVLIHGKNGQSCDSSGKFASACAALPCSSGSGEYMLVDSLLALAALVCGISIWKAPFTPSSSAQYNMAVRSAKKYQSTSHLSAGGILELGVQLGSQRGWRPPTEAPVRPVLLQRTHEEQGPSW